MLALCLGLALVLPASANDTRLELSATGTLALSSLSTGSANSAPPDGHSTLGGGRLGRWVFLAAGVELDYSREHIANESVDVGGFFPGGPSRAVTSLFVGTSWSLPVHAEAGVRWHNLRLLAGWLVTPRRFGDSDFAVGFWGGAFVQADAILRRWVAVAGRVSVIEGGAAVEAWASFWLRRRFGIQLSAGGGRSTGGENQTGSAWTSDRAQGGVALSYWFSPRSAASLQYVPAWQRLTPGRFGDSYSTVTHVLALAITARPR
jgi:hypothetical protein